MEPMKEQKGKLWKVCGRNYRSYQNRQVLSEDVAVGFRYLVYQVYLGMKKNVVDRICSERMKF